jgi:hypothetical protein
MVGWSSIGQRATDRALKIKNARQVATTEDYAFNPDDLSDDVEENRIVPDGCHARFITNVGTELIDQRVALDVEKLRAYVLDEGNGTAWIVLGDIVGDIIQIAFNR